jgi:tetratricopeptide (TPR) repeat protein
VRVRLVVAVALAAIALALWGRFPLVERPSRQAAEREGGPAPVVEDRAGRIGAFERPIRYFADAMREQLGIDLRVVTLHQPGEDIEGLAERTFRELGVGDGAPTGGILVLLEVADSRARIEVSYTLEGVLPDALLSRLARDQLAPYASYSAVGMGVMDVASLLQRRLLAAAASGELVVPRAARDALAGRSGGGGAQVAVPDVPFDRDLKRRIPDGERTRYAPSADPAESAEAFLRVRRELAGDPTLELFTEGSRVQRARYPFAPFEEWELLAAAEASRPFEIRVDGDHAIAASPRPARNFLPVLLERSGGVWRVDLVETFKSYRIDAQGEWVFWNAATPYAAIAGERPRLDIADVVPVDLGGEPIAEALARLEAALASAPELPAPERARLHFELAEILYRNAWAVVAAFTHYEEALRLAPQEWLFLDTFARRGSFVGLPELAIPFLERAGPPGWSLAGLLYEEAGRDAEARRAWRRALDASGGRDVRARLGLERIRRRAEAA